MKLQKGDLVTHCKYDNTFVVIDVGSYEIDDLIIVVELFGRPPKEAYPEKDGHLVFDLKNLTKLISPCDANWQTEEQVPLVS